MIRFLSRGHQKCILAATENTRPRADLPSPRIYVPKVFEMSNYIHELGEPDIKLAGLKLWVHGYQFRESDDYWDGNWLNATVICSEGGSSVLVQGNLIRTDEIIQWQGAVEKLGVELTGEASLQCMEPSIAVTLKAVSLGKVEMEVQITPNQLTQDHTFRFEIDQSYLLPLRSQCAQVLNAFPLRGA
jgi:hypothetical protein